MLTEYVKCNSVEFYFEGIKRVMNDGLHCSAVQRVVVVEGRINMVR